MRRKILEMKVVMNDSAYTAKHWDSNYIYVN